MFNSELREFYNNEYVLMRRFKFSYEAIANSTPAELNVYYDIIGKDLEREKKEMEQQENSASTGGVMPPKNLPAE